MSHPAEQGGRDLRLRSKAPLPHTYVEKEETFLPHPAPSAHARTSLQLRYSAPLATTTTILRLLEFDLFFETTRRRVAKKKDERPALR